MVWETEDDDRSKKMKLKIEIDGNDSLSIEHKEEIQFIFYKSMYLSKALYLIVNII